MKKDTNGVVFGRDLVQVVTTIKDCDVGYYLGGLFRGDGYPIVMKLPNITSNFINVCDSEFLEIDNSIYESLKDYVAKYPLVDCEKVAVCPVVVMTNNDVIEIYYLETSSDEFETIYSYMGDSYSVDNTIHVFSNTDEYFRQYSFIEGDMLEMLAIAFSPEEERKKIIELANTCFKNVYKVNFNFEVVFKNECKNETYEKLFERLYKNSRDSEFILYNK